MSLLTWGHADRIYIHVDTNEKSLDVFTARKVVGMFSRIQDQSMLP